MPNPESMSLDLATMQFVTETAAKAAATELGKSLRVEIREELANFERSMLDKIQAEMRAYFGQLDGDAHIVQHSELARFIEARRNAVKGFMTRVGELFAAACAVGLLVLLGMKGLK